MHSKFNVFSECRTDENKKLDFLFLPKSGKGTTSIVNEIKIAYNEKEAKDKLDDAMY